MRITLVEDKDIDALIANDFEQQRLKDEFAEKRSYPRRDTNWLGKFEFNNAEDSGTILNISRGGALVLTRLPLSEGDIFHVEFAAEDIDDLELICAQGKVKFIQEVSENQFKIGVQFKVGVEFTDISEQDADLLEVFAAEQE